MRMRTECKSCGSTQVLIDTCVIWDEASQRWEMYSGCESWAYCIDCEGECNFDMNVIAEDLE